MSKKLLLLFTFLVYCTIAMAQVPPGCEPPGTTEPAENCPSACISCGFNGYVGTSAGWGGDPQPQGWCSNIQNDQWIGFIAGGTAATFTITPGNCAQGQGLQAAVYPAGCNDDPLGCNAGCATCGSTPTVFSVSNMIVGSNYYLIIDGYSQDQCDFTISVAPPSAVQPPNVGATPQISGPATICPGGSGTYAIATVNGAGFYTWESSNPNVLFNGTPGPVDLEAPGGRTVMVTFPSGLPNGTQIQICVTPLNSCSTGIKRCKTVTLQNLPPTTLPKKIVCFEDAPYTLPWGDEVNTSGNYSTMFTTALGCDSMVQQMVQVLPAKATSQTKYVCKGGCVSICNSDYCDQGQHIETCDSYQGCDSTVTLTLNVLDPIANITGPTTLSCAVNCITLGSSASPNFPGVSIKTWRNVTTGQTTSGETLTVCQAGTYILTTIMNAGGLQCSQADTVVVTGNTIPPTATGINGYIGCGAGPAQISVTTNAANPLYSWSGCGGFSSSSQSPFVNQSCTYTVTVTNQVTGCTATATSTVTGDITPPVASATNAVITCSNPSVQAIASSNVPSNYAWSNGTNGSTATITVPGPYVVTVTSQLNNCTSTAVADIISNIIQPGAAATVAGTIGCPTPSVPLSANSPTSPVDYQWAGPGVVGAGQNPSANVAGIYTVTITNPINGCTSTATATVTGNVNLPNASATGITLDCNAPNDTIFALSSTPGVDYAWDIGGTTITTNYAQVSAPGTYTVTVTASNGCTQTASAIANGNFAAPNAAANGGIISCSANSILVTGSSSTPGVTYAWVGPGGVPFAGQNITVNAVGDYILTVAGANGCTTTATAVVSPDANLPNATASGDTITCLQGAATISGASTTPGVSFLWSGPGITPANATNQTQTVTVDGLYNLSVTNPANGCTAYSSAFVLLDTGNPDLVASGNTLTCTEPSVQLFSSSTTNGVTYAWSGPSFTSALPSPSVTIAGTYTVTVTAPNGCTSTAEAVVPADQNIPVLSTAASTITCNNPNVVINTSSSVATVTYEWTGISSQAQNPTVTLPGTYTVVATAPNGCTSSASITVNQDVAPPNASASGGTLTCLLPMLNLTGSSTTPGATFQWPALGSALQNPTVAAAGIYSLVVTGPNGCKSTVTAPVDDNFETAVIQIGVPAVLTCTDLSSILETNVLSNTAVQSISWSSGDVTEDPTVMLPGTYTVTVTLANGCSKTSTATVAQDITSPNVSAIGGTLNCTTTALNLTGASTTPGVTFAWSNGLPAVSNPSVSLNGTYTLTVTGPNGCTNTANALVAIDVVPPGATIASSNILDCNDLTATLTAGTNSGTQYEWFGFGIASGTVTPTVVVNDPSAYTLVVTAANGCTSQAVFNQSADVVPPVANASGGTIDCFTSNTQLTGASSTAGVTYKWTGPGTPPFTSAQQSPFVTVPGIYTLTVTGLNACTTTATTEVLANVLSPDATIQGSGQLTCVVTSIDLTGLTNTINSTIEWTLPDNSNASTSVIAATEPGVYTFTVTSTDNGCVTAKTLNLGQSIVPPDNLTANSSVIDCDHPTITLQGGSGLASATYEWTGPGGTFPQQNPTIGTAGTYTLVVTDPFNGCTASITEVVMADQNFPTLTAAAEIITCKVPVVTLDATSNVLNGTYNWSGPGSFSSTLQDPTTGIPGSYTVVVKNPLNGCTATFTFEASEDKVPPAVTTQNGQITCLQPSIALQASSTTPNVTYLWTAPGGTTYPIPNPTVSQPGNYLLVVTNTVNGCTSSATATIDPDLNIPVVTVTGGLITCAVPTIDLTGQTNKPNVTWQWSGPGFTSTDQNPTIDAPGTYILVVTTPINGCTGQASIVVNADIVAPNVNVGSPDKLDCTTTQVGLSATVNTAGNYTYNWTTTNGTILAGANSSTPTVSQAAPYIVLVTNTVNGCTSTRTVNVEVDPAVPSAIGNAVRDVSCFGYTNGSVAISGVTGGTAPYLFSVDNQPFIPASAFNSLPPGDHSLRVQDANGCELETTFNVGEPAELIVNLGPDTTIRLGDAITLSLDNTVNYPDRVATTMLTPSSLDTIIANSFVPTYSLQYRFAVVDSNGCRADDTRMIIVDRTRRIFVPNIFDPNGAGGVNNLLTVFGGNDVKQIKSFKIFDRWGESIHEARSFLPGDLNVAWDGKINGKEANPAVFIYTIEVLFKDGETELFSGDVTLIRQ